MALAGTTMACRAEGMDQSSGMSARASPTATTTTTSSGAAYDEKPRVAKSLARAPGSCTGPKPRLTGFGRYGNLAGSSPVWAGFYAAFDSARQIYRIERDAPRTEYGWRVKVLWVVSPGLKLHARVQGRDLATGTELWFEIGEEGSEAPFGVLDPAHPGVPPTSDGYKEFPSYMYVPRAGCYAISAEWTDGGWRLIVGLGR
jgi:hypothetical protein